MAIPGLLVEHLVVGALGLVWFLPLAGIDLDSSNGIPLGKAAALAPAVYILGMFIEFIAFVIVHIPIGKYTIVKFVRAGTHKSLGVTENILNDNRFSGSKASIAFHCAGSSEIAKEIEWRSSKDRIARGTTVNLILLWIAPYIAPDIDFVGQDLGPLIWPIIILFSCVVWITAERQSYRYQMQAAQQLAEAANPPAQ